MFLFLSFYHIIATEGIGTEESLCFVFGEEFMLIEAFAFMVRPSLVLGGKRRIRGLCSGCHDGKSSQEECKLINGTDPRGKKKRGPRQLITVGRHPPLDEERRT